MHGSVLAYHLRTSQKGYFYYNHCSWRCRLTSSSTAHHITVHATFVLHCNLLHAMWLLWASIWAHGLTFHISHRTVPTTDSPSCRPLCTKQLGFTSNRDTSVFNVYHRDALFWMNGEAFLYQVEPRMSLGDSVPIEHFTNFWTDFHIYVITAHRKLCLLPTLSSESLEPALVLGKINLLPLCAAWRPPSQIYKLQFLRWIAKQNRRDQEDIRSKIASYWRLIFAL